MKKIGLSGLIWIGLLSASFALAEAQDEIRVWRNQQGREIKAALVGVNGTEVTLKLESGVVSKILLASLSLPDQAFARQQAGMNANKVAPGTGGQKAAGVAMTWPATITINPKALEITAGPQNAEKREFEYNSGSFHYISKAPLTGSVLKDVAADFELVRQLMVQLPWGWLPQPKDGGNFKVYLTETVKDFVDLGGTDASSGGSKDDYVFLKFSALGLKKVGARYAFDARERSEGEVAGLTLRLLIADMRNLMMSWSEIGLEEFIRKIAYHKGTLRLSRLDTVLKEKIAAETRTKPDLKRMTAYLHTLRKDLRSDVSQMRVENHFDGMMLVYFFGFLDGDGKGTRLNQYFHAIAQESLGWRASRASNGKTPRPRPEGTGSYPEWGEELAKIVIADRSDEQLRLDMAAKFKAIGVKIE